MGTCLGISLRCDAQEVIPGRAVREKLAPQVMSSPNEIIRSVWMDPAAITFELTLFNESVKRLQDVEKEDPKRALVEYRRFLVGRITTPVVGVQAAIKISTLRESMKDIAGAIQTCDLFARKYSGEPSSVLLLLRKADILMQQERLAEASDCIMESMPALLEAGTASYDQTCNFLFQMAQANLASGEQSGKQRAGELYVGIEEIYLRWMKVNTVQHSWERFEALQASYKEIGDEKKAKELLPKVRDALLQTNVDAMNPEGADAYLMAARWSRDHGDMKKSRELFHRAGASRSGHHATGAILEGFAGELQGDPQLDRIILTQVEEDAKTPDAKLAAEFLVVWSYYRASDWKEFLPRSKRVLDRYEELISKGERREFAPVALDVEEGQKWAALWVSQPIVAEENNISIKLDSPLQEPVERRISIDTPKQAELEVQIEGSDRVSAVFESSPWAPELEQTRHQQTLVLRIAPGSDAFKSRVLVREAKSVSPPVEVAVFLSVSQ